MKRIDQKELARLLNVSQTTISRVVNNSPLLKEQTRRRILDKIRKSGYVPNHFAKALRGGKTHTVGFILPRYGFLEGYNTARILSGLGKTANALHYQLVVTAFDEGAAVEGTLDGIIHERRLDGVFAVLDLTTIDPKFFEFIRIAKIPFVFVNSNRTEKGLCCVGSMNSEGTYEATQHLIRKGYTRIAFVGKNRKSLLATERLNGYRRALKEHGLKGTNEVEGHGFSSLLESGCEAIRLLLRQARRPEAVVCCSDHYALVVLKEAAERGIRVPDELAVIGFGSIPESAYTVPPLTTVREDGYQIGQQAMQMMEGLIKGATLTTLRNSVATELIVRDSA